MAFDMAFDARANGAYVTDPSYAVALLHETYPHTYTSVDGYSLNAGFDSGPGNADRDATNDPRIAGVNYTLANTITFTADLSSGSAPGAGTYTIDLAFGDAVAGNTQSFILYDNVTQLIDGSNGGAGTATAADHYIDATLADVGATTTWTGATVNKAFSSTTLNLVMNPAAAIIFSTLAHFRLTLVATGSVVPVLMAEYRQRRN